MRTPEGDSPHRDTKYYDKEFELHYLAPGAFTVISPDKLGYPPPDLPQPATTYRLSPNKKRRRNAAFTIIAEAENSRPSSRSSSPSGRLSPFKGRGFNPSGSRLASPIASPPPPFDDQYQQDSNASKRSQIPTAQRRGSSDGAAFGEKVLSDSKPLVKLKEPNGLSKSLNNVSSKRLQHKPPPSPRKHQNISYRSSAFTRLSPITGSSPETVPDFPKQNQSSSPSKIPRSKSTPPSRSTSPTASKPQTRNASRNTSRNPSRNSSRDASPSSKNFLNVVPVRNNYKNVKPKVNSFNTAKPKVPPKPQVPSTKSNPNGRQKKDIKSNGLKNNKVTPSSGSNGQKPISRRNSSKQLEVVAPNAKTKTTNNNGQQQTKDIDNKKENNRNKVSKEQSVNNTQKETEKNVNQKNENMEIRESNIKETHENQTDALGNVKNVDILTISDDVTPPPSAALPSVTKTVTKPILPSEKLGEVAQDSDGENNYLPDARNLSASSVSSALNRMNNTVLDSKTVLKDRNVRDRTISPAVKAVMLFKKGSQERPNSGEAKTNTTTENSMEAKTVDEKQTENVVTTTPASTEPNAINGTHTNTNHNNNNNNHNSNNNHVFSRLVTSNGGSEKINERNIGGVDSSGVTVIDVESDRTKMSRTIVVTDVKPIQITVQEKPTSEVQSGNLIVPDPTANGLGERASLNQSSRHSDLENPEEAPKSNVCQRLASFFKTRMTCSFCKGNPKLIQAAKERLQKNNGNGEENKKDDDGEKSVGCWNCRRKLKVKEKKEKIKQDLNLVGEEVGKKKWWSKLKILKKKGGNVDKVGPTWNERRKAWMDKKFGKKKQKVTKLNTRKSLCGGKSCKDVLKMMFCVSACKSCKRKKKVKELDMRRNASITSKKKSLTPTMPVEDPTPKLDLTLVEHSSIMKGAIPVLPIPLAWICLVLNVFLPGVGTVLSGLFCLCFGIPRFSQHDGARQRIGALLIDIIIGCGQLFTVLFCLVGWGWSVWWGFIMIKLARKYKKIKDAEKLEEESTKTDTGGTTIPNQTEKDVEKGT